MDADGELEETIRQQVDEWSSNSNDCFTVELVRGDGSVTASFNPAFTYPIFGEEEAIFGYQDLDIRLSFAAHNLRPHLRITHSKKFAKQFNVEPTDIEELLRDFLPVSAFSKSSRAEALSDPQASNFTPPGEKVHEYSRDGQNYEIWCASLGDPAAKELLENMQVLVPMFIEGGSTLQLEQDWTTQRWKLFLLYHVEPDSSNDSKSSPYSLVGYGTSYRVFTFPDRHTPEKSDLDIFSPSTQSLDDFLPRQELSSVTNDLAPTAHPHGVESPLDLPSRERLSQFLILPTFQSNGHGRELYNAMYLHLSRPSNTREFTVEDPNEAFDDLRDLCDLLYLRTHEPEFAALRINPSVPPEALASTEPIPTDLLIPGAVRAALQRRTKLVARQFDRLVEMHTLSFIPPLHRSRTRITRREKSSNPHDRAYFFWRMFAKQRLYLFNRDTLAQLDREERVEKLEAALDAVQEAYVEMLEKVEAAAARDGRERKANGGKIDLGEDEGNVAAPRKSRGSKRRIVEEAEEGDEEEEDGDDTAGFPVNGRKKARVSQ